MFRSAIVFFSLSALAGCGPEGMGRVESPVWHNTASIEVKAAYFKEQCLQFGFTDGTAEMAQCIQNQMNSSQSDARARMAAVQSYQNSTRQINCRTYGNRTTCY